MNETLAGILKFGAAASAAGLAAVGIARMHPGRGGLGASLTDDEARALIAMAGRPRRDLGTVFSGMGTIRTKSRGGLVPDRGVKPGAFSPGRFFYQLMEEGQSVESIGRRTSHSKARIDDLARKFARDNDVPWPPVMINGLGAVAFRARPEPPPRKGSVKVEAFFSFAKDPAEAVAVEQLREMGYKDGELIGSLLVDLNRALMSLGKVQNPDDYEFVVVSKLKTAAMPKGPSRQFTGERSRKGEVSEKNLLYYDTMASGLNSQKAAERLGLASKGTVEAGAHRAAEILDLPWPPVPRKAEGA